MNLSRLVAEYIRSQWLNFQRALIEPQAREELLCGATISFFEPGTTTPITVFADDLHQIAHANPVYADSFGNFPAIHLDMSKPVRAVVQTMRGETLLDIADARELCGPACSQCGAPVTLEANHES